MEIEKIGGKEDFVRFLYCLAADCRSCGGEWANLSIPAFLEQMAGWIEDFSQSPMNDMDWEALDFKALARMLYMGKIYE